MTYRETFGFIVLIALGILFFAGTFLVPDGVLAEPVQAFTACIGVFMIIYGFRSLGPTRITSYFVDCGKVFLVGVLGVVAVCAVSFFIGTALTSAIWLVALAFNLATTRDPHFLWRTWYIATVLTTVTLFAVITWWRVDEARKPHLRCIKS